MKFYYYDNLFNDELSTLIGQDKLLISTINQFSFCIAEEDCNFKDALKNADILLPDGIGIVWAVNYLYDIKIKKIAGEDLFYFLVSFLENQSGSCFFLGSSEKTLALITKRMNKEYPKVKIGCYSPPFKSSFTDVESKEMIDSVNAFKPDVLFVGMTAPKQEKWSFQHKECLDAKYICCIGAVFDFYAQTIKRPSDFWINLKLEWLIRLIKEPKRMWTRYIEFGPKFVKRIFEIKKDSSLF